MNWAKNCRDIGTGMMLWVVVDVVIGWYLAAAIVALVAGLIFWFGLICAIGADSAKDRQVQ